jgi:hypothetical protein
VTKKQILTNVEIEKDIINALKNPPKEAEASYKRLTLPCIITAVLLVVIEFIYPIFILWFLLALTVFLIGSSIFHHFKLKKQIKNIKINDYEITAEIAHSVAEEHYKAETGGSVRHRRTAQINNYTIRFENGKVWRVPKELYCWNERLRMHDRGIFNSAHRGDTMIVVTEKSSGKIVVAYNTEIFGSLSIVGVKKI